MRCAWRGTGSSCPPSASGSSALHLGTGHGSGVGVPPCARGLFAFQHADRGPLAQHPGKSVRPDFMAARTPRATGFAGAMHDECSREWGVVRVAACSASARRRSCAGATESSVVHQGRATSRAVNTVAGPRWHAAATWRGRKSALQSAQWAATVSDRVLIARRAWSVQKAGDQASATPRFGSDRRLARCGSNREVVPSESSGPSSGARRRPRPLEFPRSPGRSAACWRWRVAGALVPLLGSSA